MRIAACYGRKGGVGKTATAVNLAALSAAGGARTLLIDLDPQAAATFTFRIEPKLPGGYARLLRGGTAPAKFVRASDFARLDLLPADSSCRHLDTLLPTVEEGEAPLARLLEGFAPRYDRVFLDCPPTASRLADHLFRVVDDLIVPTVPTTLSLRTVAQIMMQLKSIDPPPAVHPFFALVDLRKALHRRVVSWERETGLGFLATTIPYSSVLEQMSSRRAPVFDYAPGSGPARSYRELWAELEARIEQSRAGPPWRKKTRRAVEEAVRHPTFRTGRG